MIQRIQSLYMLLTALVSGLLLKGDIFKFIATKGNDVIVRFDGIYQTSGEKTFELIHRIIPFTALLVIIPLLSVLIIFLFKNRKLQLRMTAGLIILEILFLIVSIHLSISIINNQGTNLVPDFKLIIPVLSILFSVLAYRSIVKDENLIKSYDRLR